MKKLTEDEQVQYAKDRSSFIHTKEQFSESRSSHLADEFTKLEVQIAGLLAGFVSLFVGKFDTLVGYSQSGLLIIKVLYAVSFISLVLSLLFGLLHILRKEMFWNDFITRRSRVLEKWDLVTKKELTAAEACQYEEGTKYRGHFVSTTPMWTWILQTISLGIAVVLLLGIFLAILFV